MNKKIESRKPSYRMRNYRTYEYECLDCGETFEAETVIGGFKRSLCDDCSGNRKKERDRAYQQKRRDEQKKLNKD